MKTDHLNGAKSVEIGYREKNYLKKKIGHRKPPLTHGKKKNTGYSYSENVAYQE